MAKLYFRFGAVGSAKTLNLLAVSHNYRQQNKKILLIKPKLDNRFGQTQITSRAGLATEADLQVSKESYFTLQNKPLYDRNVYEPSYAIALDRMLDYACILVDEAQFLTENLIEDLYTITIRCNIPVIAYGLKTNFKGYLFEGSKRLLELSDRIEEIKTTCFYCEKKATHNLKLIDDKPTFDGETIDLGADEKYKPCCKICFYQFKKDYFKPLARQHNNFLEHNLRA